MSILSTISGGLAGFMTGGPLGAIAGAIGGYQGGGNTPGTAVAVRPQGLPALPSGGPGGIFAGMNNQANVWLQNQKIAPAAGSCPRGFHLNKHALSASRSHGAVPARTICVRNRSMNPLNPKALRRALGREKRARKLISRLHIYKPVRSSLPARRKR